VDHFFRQSLQIQTLLTYLPSLIMPSFSTSGSTLSITCTPHMLQEGRTFLTIKQFKKQSFLRVYKPNEDINQTTVIKKNNYNLK
jgi:hypothetical protein